MQELHYKRLTKNALPPARAYLGDAGLDLHTDTPITIPSGAIRTATTGLSVNIPYGYVGEVHIRSGMAFNYGLTLANNIGIIDHGYTGEIKLCIANLSEHSVKFPAGTRIAQLIIKKIELPYPVEIDTMPETERGDGGFGSTGH
ncbi:dUTP diphosphatase [Corynebacterium diphtheriae]|uniref:dUTP diphosphatase n=1 Tax=Corynebacterium diphtheriae TaxID=1717 RepID=UPI000D04D7C1|nr:dUTP diphosphatase [Corynebacterium diphtheriae]MBG9335716.1 dUTP diphosphatase [Corynebacterium diphtheriae bv. gravis]PSA74304.1 hypothetical protein BT092_04930 [Corynebacterium diphtheriae]CAB0504266.1 dUTP diphosphatase [Corynebacterium diphtheriae]CAB0508189.1 dUTP diphosphatase [Corynebacterium diphtheriae]CAB0508462.1 dUTP diphosphatase [Corynebacterium diphtheriae]